MEIITEYNFNVENVWLPNYSASPYYFNQKIYYPYEKDDFIVCKVIYEDNNVDEIRCPKPKDGTGCLSNYWRIFVYKGHAILSCGNPEPATLTFPNRKISNIFLDLDDEMKRISLPSEIEIQFACRCCQNETQEINIGNYFMRYKNSRSYCFYNADNEFLWKEKHKGYRYTYPELKDGCVIFGTAGFGGGLYCYRLEDGESLCRVDTKGTTRYCWQKNKIVCCSRDGALQWIDPFCGIVENVMTLPSILNDASGIYVDDRYVCVVGFDKKNMSPSVYLIDTK